MKSDDQWDPSAGTPRPVSNASWVCFDCRHVVRRPTSPRKPVPCPLCRRECFCLGRKIPVPPKHKVAAWTKLRKEMQGMTIDWLVRWDRRRHENEMLIKQLEASPQTPTRDRRLSKLRETLKPAGGA